MKPLDGAAPDPLGLIDQDDWNDLVTSHGPRVWRDAYVHAGNAADAEDAVQTAWLRLVEHLSDIREPARIGGWLRTTARREASALRRRRYGEHLYDVPPDASANGGDPNPEDLVLIADEDRRLWAAVERLDEPCRTLLRLIAAGLPYSTIAEELKRPVGSIGPTRSRCLQRLREAWT